MKLIVPVPEPNATLGAVSVPGATAGLPTPAPMLSVPIEPGFVAIIIGPLTMPPSATVSVPVPSLPMFTPKLLLQVESAPVTVTVPREPANSPMLAVLGVSLMTVPPFAIVSVPVPKAPTLSPPPGPLFQAEPGPVTVTAPVEPTDNPMEPPPPLFTVPPSWMVSVPMPLPPTTTSAAFVHVEPTGHRHRALRRPANSPTAPRNRSPSRRSGLRAFLSRRRTNSELFRPGSQLRSDVATRCQCWRSFRPSGRQRSSCQG